LFHFIFLVKPGPKKTLNIVIVGDGDTGKTCLLMAFKGRRFPGDYVPTVFETYTRDIRVEGEIIELGLWDTAGQEGYDRLRPMAYPHCDCFVICYAVDNPDSLYNVKEKWLPELEHFCPDVPKILVATKKDIRRRTLAIMDILNGNKAPSIVSYEEGMCTAAMIGASRFLETSALCNDGVTEMFNQTARVALEAREKQKEKKAKKNARCCII
jgi:Ras family protein A